jgi:hypothetical protein
VVTREQSDVMTQEESSGGCAIAGGVENERVENECVDGGVNGWASVVRAK